MKLDFKRPHVPLPPASDRAKAKTVTLDGLPPASEVAPGTLVIVNDEPPGGRSLVKSVLAFGRKQSVPRVDRCTALVLRGYLRVGAGTDPDTNADLAWAYAPGD